MNLIEILKNLPSGTKLYSLVSGEVTFKEIRSRNIVVLNHNHCEQLYHCTGRLWNSGLDGECLLFPSKENRDWDTFCPFKKGDIIASENTISIVDHVANLGPIENVIYYQACIDSLGRLHVKKDSGVDTVKGNHLAGRIEKQRILRMLDEAGYEFDGVNVKPKKYEFTPFEKVLVRDSRQNEWKCDFFSHTIENKTFSFRCVGHFYSRQCIPYNEETKHLIGTTDSPPKKYITWE